jgi:Response regulator containing a CheY-like receiver domain and an HTH DNA-binding domain
MNAVQTAERAACDSSGACSRKTHDPMQSQTTETQPITRVALVEDSNTLRQCLARLISRTPGMKCVCSCGTAEEALIEIPKARPDVVLMDIHLPGESGIVCTARLRDLVPQPQIIMLTVYNDIKVVFEALKAGACGYVLKRSEEKEILAAIAEVRSGGAPMTSEIARMVVRSFMEPAREPLAKTEQLSTREMEILALLAEGLSNKEIAAKLFISPGTVRGHLMHIYEKLHVRCRTEAAMKYMKSHPVLPKKI